ncbi:MAG: RNA polymerase sigma factor [Sinimarinibacterium sp.]|jgi:RNA polymerase sigma-70 factor (ECF subfamily)
MGDTFRSDLIALLPRLHRFALALSTDRDRADDLVQAACERALTRRAQWQPGTQLDSWMFTILRNLWIDQLRARPREVVLDDDALEALPDDRDWNREIEAQMSLDRVLAVMRELSPALRSVLGLVCVDGRSYKEAAEALGVPIGTVMSRLSRGRMELLRRLGTPQGVGHDATV